jgi:hypothetical protein
VRALVETKAATCNAVGEGFVVGPFFQHVVQQMDDKEHNWQMFMSTVASDRTVQY